jgi:hypothetical protein
MEKKEKKGRGENDEESDLFDVFVCWFAPCRRSPPLKKIGKTKAYRVGAITTANPP